MIEKSILKTIQDHKMLQKGDKVMVGVSGGVDSTALIYILDSLKQKLGIKLYLAHLNHLIRGRDTDLDEKYVREISKNLDIKCIIEKLNVPEFAKQNKLGLEDAARRVRYNFYERAARKTGANKIAVAHNANDNVETFLMRLIRGTGIRGLEGIPPKRGRIIRPLIGISREEIEIYLKKKNIKPRIDISNYDISFLRNSIRHKLLPLLRKYNGNINGVLLRTISMIKDLNEKIDSQAEKSFKRISSMDRSGILNLDIRRMKKLDKTIRSEVLRKAIGTIKADLTDITFQHIDDILFQMEKGRGEIHLPGIYIYVKRGAMLISGKKDPKRKNISFSYRLAIPGKIEDKGKGFVLRADIVKSLPLSRLKAKNPYQAFIDYDKINKPLIIRNRRPGDRFHPLGLKGSKKLQDIFVDQKVDIDDRDNIPVIDDGEKIVWVAGYRMSEEVKVTPKTRKIVKLTAWTI
jgi:tRNA(Ile)-lysidine synthase